MARISSIVAANIMLRMSTIKRSDSILTAVGSCLAMLLLSACGKGADDAPAKADAAASATVVTTQVVGVGPWNDTISALGTVKAHESITVTAKVSETVQRVHFESGDEVAQGTVLVTLTGNQQQAALSQAEASAREAQQQYQRGTQLARQQLIARSMLDTQRATLDAADARVLQMRADIGDRSIRAPFAGVLGIRQVSPGALVTPGAPVATLDDISEVFVDFPVPETHLARLERRQPLTGASVAWPGQIFSGVVTNIDTRVDAQTRAVTVRGEFPNADRRLRPGMLMQVALARPQREALVVPEIAVVQVGRDTFMWRGKPDGTVERATIQVGSRRGGQVEVVQGVAAGDRVVVEGTGKMRPGLAVTEAPRTPTPPAAGTAGDGPGPAASGAATTRAVRG